MNTTSLRKRVIDISYKKGLSHIGSCLTALPIIADIYKNRSINDPFVLSAGHAALALYVVLEAHGIAKDAEALFDRHGVHPGRDLKNGIYCSTGSLGLGLPVALGMAMAHQQRKVYCLISDGECAEGSIWESLIIADKHRVKNLNVYVNANGFSAYDSVDLARLSKRLQQFTYPNIIFKIATKESAQFLNGLEAHYHKLTESEYETLL